MPEVRFSKYHGLGNDFVIVDGVVATDVTINGDQARILADRRHGIGADQVLLLGGEDGGEFSYRIWNQDGGEVAQCGNGARSAHAFLRMKGYAKGRTRLKTKAGIIEVEDGATGPRAYLGVPEFEPAKIPLARDRRQEMYGLEWGGQKLEFAAVAIGNPHCVFWVDDPKDAPVEKLGSHLNSSGDFPQGVNASFAHRTGPGAISLRVFERGVGETPACGSAAAACAVAAHSAGATSFDIEAKGGLLRAGWDGGGAMAWVEGAVAHVFDGTIGLA